MDMPDVTLVQKLGAAVSAAVGAVVTCLALFGVVTPAQGGGIVGMVGTLVAVYVAADAVIRNGRARALQNPDAIRELQTLQKPHIRK